MVIMKHDTIKSGDLVTLKSGSSLMVVAELSTEGNSARCYWWVDGTSASAWFPTTILALKTPNR